MSVQKRILAGEQKESRRVRQRMSESRSSLVCVISDDNGLRTRASSLLRYGDRVQIVPGGVSYAAVYMFDKMFEIATDPQKERLLTVFSAATQDMDISQRVGDAANAVSKELKKKEKLTSNHITNFLQPFENTHLAMHIHNLQGVWTSLQGVWRRMTPYPIPDIPVLPDGSIRIAGCAGTERLCTVLRKLIQQIDNGSIKLEYISKVIVGRHGLSTKSYTKEFNKLDEKTGMPRFPDHGHNVKIHGEEGHERVYFELLEALKMRCGTTFHHLTTNSFFTDENNNGVAGTRLSGLELMKDGAPVLKIYGNAGTYSRDPQAIDIQSTRVLDNILTTLCFTPNHATFLHDLKLCWILSNYETVGEYFKPQNCHLWCGLGKDGTDMLFIDTREGYDRVLNIVGEQLEANIKRVQDNFLTTHSDSWAVNEAFHTAANDGIRNLQISAIVTDPGPGHVTKAQKGYFPLGPQDGDDLLAIEAIVGLEGVEIRRMPNQYAGEMKTGTRLRY